MPAQLPSCNTAIRGDIVTNFSDRAIWTGDNLILEVDHIIPRSHGGGDHVENLQLLCGHCNRVMGDRPQEYLVARLREMGMVT